VCAHTSSDHSTEAGNTVVNAAKYYCRKAQNHKNRDFIWD
jgi:hypothetical protein